MKTPSFTRRPSLGISLIEVLITLAVLSLGLAGLSAMQMDALQNVHAAHYRSLASTVALDLEERLWLELANNSLSGCPDVTTGEGSPAAELIDDWSRSAANEDWAWTDSSYLNLPNLSVSAGAPVAANSVTEIPVTLSWTDSRFTDLDSATESFTYNVRIVCRPDAS